MEIRALLRRPAVVAAVTLFLVVVSSVLYSMFYAAPAQADDDDGEFVNGEIVVKLKEGTDLTRFNLDYGTTTKDTFLGRANIHLLQVTDGGDTEAKADAMESDPERVFYAEPNLTTDAPEGGARWRFRGDGDPIPSSDPAPYSGQYAVGALNLECTRDINKGAGTVIAVLDTGAQPDHPELSGSLTPGYDFIGDDANPAEEPNGLDDDGDTHVDEGTGHGTHVAGIVHLVAPEAKIMPLRVLDSDGMGNVFVIAEAVQYAVKNDADVINMSLGSSQDSELLEDVIEDLEADDDADDDDADDDDGPVLEGVPPNGVVVAASAGNDNVETPQYPAAEDGVLAVTSVNQQEKKSEWANYGSWTSIAAPGEDVYSAFPTDRYASWNGTSMAAPFVAGQAALIRSVDPSLDAAAVRNTITGTARSLDAANPSYAGKLGAGHADAGASMEKLRPGAGCGAPAVEPANTKPIISDVSPAAGSATRDRTPTIKAKVRDAQTELRTGDITLYVAGNQIRRTSFSYNVATDRLSYASNRLARAKHRVTIIARDAQGLVGSKIWSFGVRSKR